VFSTLSGKLSIGQMTFLVGAIAGTTNNFQSFFSTFSSIADQSLYLTDLLEFFAVEPQDPLPPATGPRAPAHPDRL